MPRRILPVRFILPRPVVNPADYGRTTVLSLRGHGRGIGYASRALRASILSISPKVY